MTSTSPIDQNLSELEQISKSIERSKFHSQQKLDAYASTEPRQRAAAKEVGWGRIYGVDKGD